MKHDSLEKPVRFTSTNLRIGRTVEITNDLLSLGFQDKRACTVGRHIVTSLLATYVAVLLQFGAMIYPQVSIASLDACGLFPGDCDGNGGVLVTADRPNTGFGFSGGFNGAGLAGSQNGRFDGGNDDQPLSARKNMSKADDKTKSDSDKECATPHPVVIENGNKVYPVVDIKYSGENGLELKRNYDKAYTRVGAFGNKWASTLDYSLQFTYSNGSTCGFTPGAPLGPCSTTGITSIKSFRPSGESYTYTFNAGVAAWLNNQNLPYPRISNSGGYWILSNRDGSAERYNLNGSVSSIANEYGIGWTFNYSGFIVSNITHTSGRYIAFNWESNKVKTAQDVDGHLYVYDYDSNGFLKSVTTPTNDVESYVYEDANQPGGLTGTYYNGLRYGRYTYNPDGTVLSSGLDGNIETLTFSYTPDNGSGKKYTQIKNTRGAVTTYEFDLIAGHYLLAMTSRVGVSGCPNKYVSTTYDVNGYPQKATDARGNVSFFRYGADGLVRVKKVGSGSDEQTFSYDWDAATGHLKTIKHYPPGSQFYQTGTGLPDEETDYVYVASGVQGVGRIKSITMTNLSSHGVANQSRVTSYSYQLWYNGLPSQIIVTPPAHSPITYSFTSSGDLQQILDSSGHSDLSDYNGLGQARTIKDQNGQVTNYDFDGRGRLIYEGRTRLGIRAEKKYSYDGMGHVTKLLLRPSGTVTNYSYDALGRLMSIDNNIGDKRGYKYNSLSKADVETFSIPNGDTVKITRYLYDEIGNLVSAIGNNGQTLNYTYDAADHPKTISDSNHHTIEYTYNAFDQVVSQKNTNGDIARYSYDGSGQIASVTDYKNLVTTYTHDGLGNLVGISSPETANTANVFDEAGRLIQATRGDSSTLHYDYDDLGRLKRIYQLSGQSRVFGYDNCTNGIGRLCTANVIGIDGSVTDSVTYSYTGNGYVSALSASSLAGKYSSTMSWTYTPDNQISSITYPSGNQVKYSYDAANRVSSISAVAGIFDKETTVVSGIKYQPFGPEASMLFGSGEVRSLGYDLDGRLRSIKSGAVQNLSYDYDVGNQLHRINDLSGGTSSTLDYDNVGRLANAVSPFENLELHFDSNSNRTLEISQNTSFVSFVPDSASNRYLYKDTPTRYSYEYDKLGNITKTADSNPINLSYDQFGEVSAVSIKGSLPVSQKKVTNYYYNAFGLRTLKSGSGVADQFFWGPEGYMLAEKSLVESDYIWLNGRVIAMMKNGSIDYVHNDHLGRPEVVTSSNKFVLWQAHNLSFDRIVARNLIGGFNLGFPGQYYDAESGFYYNQNRYYDPNSGRYLESDPVGLNGGLNPYIYASGDPAGIIDFRGLEGATVSLESVSSLISSQAPIYVPAFVSFSLSGFGYASSLTFDIFGNIYGSPPGAGFGKPTGSASFSAVLGLIEYDPCGNRSAESNTTDILSGLSYTATYGVDGIVGGVTTSPSSGTGALLIGVGTPSYSVSGGYAFKLN